MKPDELIRCQQVRFRTMRRLIENTGNSISERAGSATAEFDFYTKPKASAKAVRIGRLLDPEIQAELEEEQGWIPNLSPVGTGQWYAGTRDFLVEILPKRRRARP